MGLRTLGGLSLPEGRFGRPKPLPWTEVDCDAAVLLEAATNLEWQRVTDLHKGPFLAGVDIVTGNVELEEWLHWTCRCTLLRASYSCEDGLVERPAPVGVGQSLLRRG